MKRFVRDDEFVADAFVAGQKVGKIILLGDRTTQVVLRNQPQTKRRFAEPQSVRLLQLHDLLDALDAELPLFRENAADATVITCKDAPRSFDRQDILLGIHRHSSAWIRQGSCGSAWPAEQTVSSGLPGIEQIGRAHV